MGKQRREILVRLMFAKSSLSTLARCDQTEEYHPLFAYLADECNNVIDFTFTFNARSRKKRAEAFADAHYADAVVGFIREELLKNREKKNVESKNTNIYLCSAAIIFLDDAWNIAGKNVKGKINHVVSEVCKMEMKLDGKGLFDNVRDDAVAFVNEIYKKGLEYNQRGK